ncbi:MAG: helix-turn-helix transcriptional regulator [Myxococcales bacterium]|nr:helix-turn-helix transcriptional regulator [Myxococcales bacterium]
MLARTPEDVGSLIREQRLARGMTQAQLAQAIGASRQWVVDLERGKSTLALGLVLRAVTAVGLSLRVETSTTPALAAGHPVIDLDAVLARARTPALSAPNVGRGTAGASTRTDAEPKARDRKKAR